MLGRRPHWRDVFESRRSAVAYRRGRRCASSRPSRIRTAMISVSPAERRAIFKLVIRTGIRFGHIQEILTGQRQAVGWLRKAITDELGEGWEQRYAKSSTS